MIKGNESKDKIKIIQDYESVNSMTISYDDLINNNGINIFKFNNGIISYLLKEEILIKITYKEKEYTSFYEYISSQLHLNLSIIINKAILEKYNTGYKIYYKFFFFYNIFI